MLQGRRKHDFELNSRVVAAVLNSQFGRQKEVQPWQVNPMHERQSVPVSLGDVFGF